MEKKNGCFLPEGILENILWRLPAKTIVKFKMVSKEWESLISSGYFKRLHDEKSLKNLSLMLLSDPSSDVQKPVVTTVGLSGDVLDRWDLVQVGINGPCTMLSSPSGSNDLMCLVDDKKRYVVCDPSTKQTICLPKPKAEISAAGFGYLPNNQYVIVSRIARKDWQMITFSRDRNGFSVGGGWKAIEDCELYHLDGLRWGVYANGALYWMRLKVLHVQLVCFDLCKEEFSIISMPQELKDRKIPEQLKSSLLELGGDLHFVCRRTVERFIELWKLDDARNGRWTKQYIRTKNFKVLNGIFRPLLVNLDGEMLVYNGGFLEWYSLQDGVFRIKKKGRTLTKPKQYNSRAIWTNT